MKFKQCVLVDKNNRKATVFLDADVIKVGLYVTLKDSLDPKKWWKIDKIYNAVFKASDIKDSHESKNWFKKDHFSKLKGLGV